MLSPSSIPAVEACLDPTQMQARLQRQLPECVAGGFVVDDLQISHVRRSSSLQRHPHPVTLCYELTLRQPASGRTQVQRYYAKMFRHGASAAAAAGTPAIHLPALDLLLWPWPADPGLPQLATLLDPAQARPWWGTDADAVEVLRHEPERRATLRYTRGQGAQAQALFAKTFSDDRGEQIHQRFVHFWQQAQGDEQAATVAEPLGYTPDTRTLWQVQARGTPLAARLAQPTPGLAQRTAAAFARLHTAPPSLAGPRPRHRAHWLKEVRRREQKIGRAAPELAGRASRLADRLELATLRWAEPAPSLIHGDCHPDQCWVDGSRLVLFDFDEFALGDPMEDLAEFVTKLQGLDGGPAFAVALMAAYARAAPAHHDPRRLQWHRAVQLLLQASRAFVFQVPGWRDELERRLARAEALAAHPTPETCA